MFVNNCLIFIFDLVQKIMQNSNHISYIKREGSENTPGQFTQAKLTQGQAPKYKTFLVLN